MYRARARLCMGEYARHVYRALLAELRQPAPRKGSVSISMEDGCLVISIESGSLNGLRALLNSFLYLAHAAYSSLVESELSL